jgi:FkbM family methyltransferase
MPKSPRPKQTVPKPTVSKPTVSTQTVSKQNVSKRPRATTTSKLKMQQIDKLRNDIKGAYARLHTGKLTSADVMSLSDIEVGDIAYIVGSADYLRQQYEDGCDLQPDVVVFGGFSKDDGVIFDIGAHWGYSAVCLRQSGTDCQIVSFEPMGYNWPSLEELKRLESGSYDYVMCALSNQAETIKLYSPAVNGRPITGLNSEGESFNDSQIEHILDLVGTFIPEAAELKFNLLQTEIAAYRLDDLLMADFTKVDVHKVAAIKLDVEGHERAVLDGSLAMFERDRPFAMIEGGNRDQPVVEFLTGLGYEYGERSGKQVVPTSEISSAVNGYWFHKDRRAEYESKGILAEAP